MPEKYKPKIIGLLIWSMLVLLQSLIWLDTDNLLAAALTLAGGIIGVSSFAQKYLLTLYPISTTMLVGFTTYYFLLPPIATFVEWKPLTNNLVHPVLVSVHALVCLLALLVAHRIYRSFFIFQGMRHAIAERVYRPLGFFNPPSNLHLLAMGSIGMLAMSQQIFIGGGSQQELLGAGNKFLQALYPLTYVPYAILVRPVMGDTRRLNRQWIFILATYTVLLVLISMGRNSRSAFAMGMVSILMVYGYGLAIQLFSDRILRARNVLLAAVGLLLIGGPVADFATSMVIVRGQRSSIAPMQLVEETITTFQDKEAIRAYRLSKEERSVQWDERYVDNLFISRLSNLKYSDNSIDLAMSLNADKNTYLWDFEWQRTLSVYPRPVLEFLGIDVDKDMVTSASGGDLMLYVATGSIYALGGFRTGSMFGSGYAMFGWFYPIVLALLSIVLFMLADAQTSRNPSSSSSVKGESWMPVLSPMAIAKFFTWFFYLTSAATGVESLSEITQFILRGWLQVLVIYAFSYWATYLLLRPLRKARV